MKLATPAHNFPALWASMINDGKVDEVIALYADGATLMPTFSPHTLKTRAGIVDYFTQLASRKGLNVKLHKNTVEIVQVNDHVFQVSGIYSFRFKVDGTLLTFPSRFTFLIDLEKAAPIMHHHSSQIPRTLN